MVYEAKSGVVCVPVASLTLEGRGIKDCEYHVKFSSIVTSYPGREGRRDVL